MHSRSGVFGLSLYWKKCYDKGCDYVTGSGVSERRITCNEASVDKREREMKVGSLTLHARNPCILLSTSLAREPDKERPNTTTHRHAVFVCRFWYQFLVSHHALCTITLDAAFCAYSMPRPQHQVGFVTTCPDRGGDAALNLVLDFSEIYYRIYAPPLSGCSS